MIESFVDLTYRGLALGRRIKLTQVRPTTGYLELPMPMPVGTQIEIATDEGVALAAVVTAIYEQIGGVDRVPGMTVKPVLEAEAAQAWWQARVALPEEADDKPPARSRPITVRPRTHTVPTPPPEPAPLTKEVTATKELSVYVAEQPAPAAPVTTEVTATKELSVYVAEQPAEPEPQRPAARTIVEEDIKRTTVMNAVDQELLAKLTSSDGDVEHLVRRTGEHDIVDDGQRTTVMDAVDVSGLGLEVSASGSFRAQTDSEATDDDSGNGNGNGGDSKPAPTKSGGKKRKKKR